jgi:hypothetical protein
MALFTSNLCMSAFEYKSSFTVIKLTHGFYGFERVFHMTLGTILSEFIFMRVFMAIDTTLKLQPGELLKVLTLPDTFQMAFLTQNFRMFSFKLVFGFVVVKF